MRPRCDHDARVGRQRREERLSQPSVEQPQPLRRVDHEHEGNIGEAPDRVEEALRGRLDGAAVDGDDLLGLGAERAQQRRLARAGDAVDDGDHRPVVIEELAQRRELALAADQRAAARGQQRPERHAGAGAGSAALTTVVATCLIASVGSFIASEYRSSTSGPVASFRRRTR